jgi:hypothetical protein
MSIPHPQHPERSPSWQPVLHQAYFAILGDGTIQVFHWGDTPFDHGAWQLGNCFRTYREAERAREVLRQVLWDWHRDPER